MHTTNFTDLYASSFARLVGQVTVVTADRDAAEEAVQEAFGRLWKGWETLGAYDRPEAWVRRVAINVAISRWRRVRRLRPLGDGPRVARDDDPVLRHDVQRALRALPVKQRGTRCSFTMWWVCPWPTWPERWVPQKAP